MSVYICACVNVRDIQVCVRMHMSACLLHAHTYVHIFSSQSVNRNTQWVRRVPSCQGAFDASRGLRVVTQLVTSAAVTPPTLKRRTAAFAVYFCVCIDSPACVRVCVCVRARELITESFTQESQNDETSLSCSRRSGTAIHALSEPAKRSRGQTGALALLSSRLRHTHMDTTSVLPSSNCLMNW